MSDINPSFLRCENGSIDGARIGVRIYNLYGALVLQLPEQYHSGGQWCQELPTEQLASGVYVCVVSVGHRQYRQLVLVVR